MLKTSKFAKLSRYTVCSDDTKVLKSREILSYLLTDLVENLFQRLFSAVFKVTITVSVIELCKVGFGFIRGEPHVVW